MNGNKTMNEANPRKIDLVRNPSIGVYLSSKHVKTIVPGRYLWEVAPWK